MNLDDVTELHRLEWKHPNLGQISEVVCRQHEGDVLAALRLLGMGSGGRLEHERPTCDRCRNSGVRPLVWLRSEYKS